MNEARVRRVVTGHDEKGTAIVRIDDEIPITQIGNGVIGDIWRTAQFPVDNTESGAAELDDPTRLPSTGISIANGSAFRMYELAPGARSKYHRSTSHDYGVIVAGEMILELDNGIQRRLAVGDTFVQRGTGHSWINDGGVPARMIAVILDARPLTVGGATIEPIAAGLER